MFLFVSPNCKRESPATKIDMKTHGVGVSSLLRELATLFSLLLHAADLWNMHVRTAVDAGVYVVLYSVVSTRESMYGKTQVCTCRKRRKNKVKLFV